MLGIALELRLATFLTAASALILAIGGSAKAAPILISGEYTLNIHGSVMLLGEPSYEYPAWDQTVTESVVDDFSDSLSDAADASTFFYESAASVSFGMSDSRIEAAGMAEAHTPNGIYTPDGVYGYALVGAEVDLDFSFSLAVPHFVEGKALFNMDSGAARAGYSSNWHSDIPVSLVDYTCGNPATHWCVAGILEPGTYAMYGSARAAGGGPGPWYGGAAPFSFAMDFTPIPEPSTALLLALGLAMLAGQRRRSS